MAKNISISEFPLWQKAKSQRTLLQLTLELTVRCNNNCVHCYNNLRADDLSAIEKELSTQEVKEIIDQAVDLGVLWVLITGGEPLLREDFFEIYTYIKKKGLIVSVFTNATLISQKHLDLFQKYPPRDIEVTVYGLSEKKYAAVARTRNYRLFMEGLKGLLGAKIPLTLKATVMKANFRHLEEIADFCTDKSYKIFRFDPFLFLRTDKNKKRNQEIIHQRLSAPEILLLEQADARRMEAVQKQCARIDSQENLGGEKLFHCGAGLSSCMVDSNGFFRLCGSLVNENCVYDLKKGSLKQAWENFAPVLLNLKPESQAHKDRCGKCKLLELCSWCPAKADLETNSLDGHIQYLCTIASERYECCIVSKQFKII